MNLTGYLRVSTDRQVTDGLGLDTQRDTITTWARTHRHTLTTWCTDEGISGSNGLERRPGIAEALDTIHDGGAAGIVVARLDRLARDLIVQEQILADARRRGGRVFSCSPGEDQYLDDDDTDPSRKLIRQVLGAVAEYDRAMTRARMLAGQRRKAAAGGYAWGAPPYGWRSDGRGSLVPVPWERDQIAIMRALRAQTDGDGNPTSYRQIAATLDASGSKPRKGGKWNANAIRKILDREARAQGD